MQRNQYFKVQIFSLFIVTAPLVSWALTNITPENIESDEREESAQRFQDIDMLCRVKISLRENIQNELKCRYTNHGNAFLTLAPFTEAEEAYVEPRIVIFHDVIYDEEIEILKKLTQPKIKLGEVKANEKRIQKGRIGQISWIDKDKHDIVNVLNRRIEHMTRLSVANAEPVQVCYYTIGDMFLWYFDFLLQGGEALVKDGDRIVTLLYYWNDVEEGGRLAFPRINVSVTPKKGSALFWYNLTPNGIGYPLTMHAGCHVIAGTKWVANVWFRETCQEFFRPCTLENQPAVD